MSRGRRHWSLRARLLTGLLVVTTLFLIAIGTVTTIVLRNLDQQQFNTSLQLTAKGRLEQIATAGNGYSGATIHAGTGLVELLTPATPQGQDLVAFLDDLVDQRQVKTWIQAHLNQVFDLTLPSNGPNVRASVEPRAGRPGFPASNYAVIVIRPVSAITSSVRGVVLAEFITGAALLTLLALGGRWLIGRGLAPIDQMASTADLITSQGDLTARMPDPGDQAEAARLAASINTMLDRIEEAFRARWYSEQKVRQFAADASHELRTPLTTIRGYAELYRQGALGDAQLPDAMRRIEQESDRMSSLVAELLELARLDRTSSLDLTETDLAELVRDAVADARAVEPERAVNASAPASLVVLADEPRLRQVLANLLGNVREHTPPRTPVTIRLAQAGHGALLEVSDAGPGMSEEAAARAFDRFYRGPRHNGASREPGGRGGVVPPGARTSSGLGLSIVQAIAAAHGGHAMLRSAAGAGTTVQVWVPFRSTEAERAVVSPAGLS
jgi:signal transduction histidine kinase